MNERRVFDRFTTRFPVKFQHSRKGFGSEVFLRDASAQGARLATRQRLFMNDSVSLEVQLPDGFSPLVLNGRVTWVQAQAANLWEMGLEFYKIDLMKMSRLFRLVTEHF